MDDLRSAIAARIAVLTKAKKFKAHERHFIRLLEKHMEECVDHNCVIVKVTGVDPDLPGNEDWVQKVISNLTRFFQGEALTDDDSSEGEG